MEETRIAPDLIAADSRPACAGHEGGRPATLVDGRFTLQERIDSGGMAAVYRAHDHRLGRPVAVKLMHEHTGSDPVKVERFRREARAMAALEHPTSSRCSTAASTSALHT